MKGTRRDAVPASERGRAAGLGVGRSPPQACFVNRLGRPGKTSAFWILGGRFVSAQWL